MRDHLHVGQSEEIPLSLLVDDLGERKVDGMTQGRVRNIVQQLWEYMHVS